MSYNPSGSGPTYTPPPGGPAYDAGGTPAPMVSQAGMMDVVNSWISTLTKPSVQTLAAEVPRTSQNRIMMSVGMGVVGAAILAAISGIISGSIVGSFISAVITSIIGYVVFTGAIYIGARLMKGTGTVEQQAWVQSTFWAPITILSNIPLIGWLIGIAGFFYQLYLLYLTNQAVHRLDSSNSAIALLIGAVIYLAINFIVGLVIAAVLLAIGLGAAASGAVLGH